MNNVPLSLDLVMDATPIAREMWWWKGSAAGRTGLGTDDRAIALLATLLANSPLLGGPAIADSFVARVTQGHIIGQSDTRSRRQMRDYWGPNPGANAYDGEPRPPSHTRLAGIIMKGLRCFPGIILQSPVPVVLGTVR